MVASTPRRWHFLLLAIAWTTFAVYGSLVPLRYQAVSFDYAIDRFMHLPPLWVGMGTRADWVANILLFIPLTFFWMGALVAERRPFAVAAAGIVLAVLSTAAAVGLEFTQIWFAGRTVSRNDILAETIGGLVGIVTWMAIGPSVITAWRSYASDQRPRATLRRILALYFVGFALFSVIPLDLTISVTDLYGKYRRGLVILVPFAYGYDSPSRIAYQFFADIATFIPVGAWVALSRWSRLRGLSPFMSGLVVGGIIALGLEIAQLVVLSRFTDSTDILLGAVGSGIGSWLVARTTARGRLDERVVDRSPVAAAVPWLLALAAYSIFLAVGFWYPFDLTHDRALIHARYEGFFRVPFLSLYLGPEFNAITQLLIRLLLFAPLGIISARVAALARSPAARAALTVAGLAYAAVLATGIEMVQILLPPKIADATEVAICFAGIVVGFLVGRRLIGAAGDLSGVAQPSGEADVPAAGRTPRPR